MNENLSVGSIILNHKVFLVSEDRRNWVENLQTLEVAVKTVNNRTSENSPNVHFVEE